MYNIFKKLFCLHKWQISKEISINNKDNVRIGTIFIYICETCGKIKKLKIMT